MTKGEAGAEAEEAARPDPTEPQARQNLGFPQEGDGQKLLEVLSRRGTLLGCTGFRNAGREVHK